MPMRRRWRGLFMPELVLCADDFALSRGTSEAIAALAEAGRLNAVSCMAALPGWEADAALLRGIPRLRVGLHLALSDDLRPLTAMPRTAPHGRLPHCDRLARDAVLGRVALDETAAEIDAQLQRFRAVWGAPPAFVDGHQHVHVLPGIRAQVIDATRRHAPDAWVRHCGGQAAAMLARPFAAKALASAAWSAGLPRALARAGLACNDGFAGHYDFAGNFQSLFGRFLARPGRFHLVMCHPGAADRPGDGIAAARVAEARALWALCVGGMAAEAGLAFA